MLLTFNTIIPFNAFLRTFVLLIFQLLWTMHPALILMVFLVLFGDSSIVIQLRSTWSAGGKGGVGGGGKRRATRQLTENTLYQPLKIHNHETSTSRLECTMGTLYISQSVYICVRRNSLPSCSVFFAWRSMFCGCQMVFSIKRQP